MDSNADLDFPGGHKFVEAYLTSSDTLAKITIKMKQLLANLDTESSQWELDQELNKGTEDYKITLKHRFDTTITSMQDIEVYPFKPSAKLYHVVDNTSDGNGWVKASCGGIEVFDSWNTQKDKEFYLLDGTGEKIVCSCLPNISYGLSLDHSRSYDTLGYVQTVGKNCVETGWVSTIAPAGGYNEFSLSINFFSGDQLYNKPYSVKADI